MPNPHQVLASAISTMEKMQREIKELNDRLGRSDSLGTFESEVDKVRHALANIQSPHYSLLGYVLQDDVHNRLTPRIVDIAYTAFMMAKQKNDEDGGPTDWFTDTKPTVTLAIDKLRRDMFAESYS